MRDIWREIHKIRNIAFETVTEIYFQRSFYASVELKKKKNLTGGGGR